MTCPRKQRRSTICDVRESTITDATEALVSVIPSEAARYSARPAIAHSVLTAGDPPPGSAWVGLLDGAVFYASRLEHLTVVVVAGGLVARLHGPIPR